MDRLRFGIFLAPFHPAGENPTLALQRDLELIEHLDRLGYDEAWIGEHHSAGSEIIASPEIFIAAAAERTQPHQARHRRDLAGLPQPALGGRAHGAARPPHARPRDARRRPRLAAHRLGDDRPQPDRHARAAGGRTSTSSCGCCAATSRSPVETPTHKLIDARLHLRPYSEPHFDVAVAAVASPTGPAPGRPLRRRAAVDRRHADRGGLRRARPPLERRWRSAPRHFGTTVDRAKWRLVGADAHRRDARAGLPRRRVRHRARGSATSRRSAAFPQMAVEGGDVTRDDRLRQRGGHRRHRHGRGRGARRSSGSSTSPAGFGCHAPAGPRVGQPGGDEALLRADRPARDAALPGRRRSATLGRWTGHGTRAPSARTTPPSRCRPSPP